MPELITDVAVEDLKLDAENPRLPEPLIGARQSEVLRHLHDGTLEEIGQSLVDHGYFAHEPLIVLRDAETGACTVIEGNRRLAALMILHGHPESEGLAFVEVAPTAEQLDRLRRIPCFKVETRDEAHDFLGFRHIGGIKRWEPEAKARYLLGEVKRVVERDSANPFRDVGRRVGSNAQGVRNSYVALRTLQVARGDFGIEVGYIQQQRFGVWQRCMNATDIKQYIGLDSPKTYFEVEDQLQRLRSEPLREVIGDLTPKGGRRKALVTDSRQVTDYGRIILNVRARLVLRKHENFEIARQIVDQSELPVRLSELVDRVKVLYEELPLAEISTDLLPLSEELQALARAIHELVVARAGTDA